MTLRWSNMWWLFRGKEGRNNRKIIELLVKHEEPMNPHQICVRLGVEKKNYPTFLYRTKNLEKHGILEKAGETRKKSQRFQLSPNGLAEAAHELNGSAKRLAIDRCRKSIVASWREFSEVYGLEGLRTEWPAYRYFTGWLESDQGILHFLTIFGGWPLAGRAAALSSFRNMIEIALLRLHGAWMPVLPAFGVEYAHGEWVTYLDRHNPYRALAEIAVRHERFSRLDAILRRVEGPLYTHIEKLNRAELVKKLSAPLGERTAKRLAITPFFKDRSGSDIGVSSLTLSLFSPESFFEVGAGIWTESGRVIIITDDPAKISEEWKQCCELRVPARRGSS